MQDKATHVDTVTVGILALQGAFIEHQAMLQKFSCKTKVSVLQVRTAEELIKCDALVIPGGAESTTIALLAKLSNLMEPLKEFVRTKPVWGTCAGAILLAQSVTNTKKGGQELLGGVDITVARNGWGSQAESFEASLQVECLRKPDVPFTGVFIRAPVVLSLLDDPATAPIKVICRLPPDLLPPASDASGPDQSVVALRQGHHLLTTFHPELTSDSRFHEYFVKDSLFLTITISVFYIYHQKHTMSQPQAEAPTTHTVKVSSISDKTTERHLHDYFSFCGKIEKIEFDEKATPKTAVIHFSKPSAAKTALMLNGGALDGAALSVTSDVVHQDEVEEPPKEAPQHIEQSDKPRAGIAAEYLAKGYVLSDHILQRAIQIDNEKGISQRFLHYFHNLDASLGRQALGPEQTISGKVTSTLQSATQQMRQADEARGLSKTASEYYTRALASVFGQSVRDFYTSTSKQIQDIHEEARRLAKEYHAAEGHGAGG
ncbi:hypothetical protein EWM64_g10634, partial [Hericium alpestre]